MPIFPTYTHPTEKGLEKCRDLLTPNFTDFSKKSSNFCSTGAGGELSLRFEVWGVQK